MNTIRKYGWKRQNLDHRDWWFSPSFKGQYDKQSDWRAMLPECYDQEEEGSCTAQAVVGAVQFLQKQHNDGPLVMPSRNFLYYNERRIEGTTDSDSGAMIRDGIKSTRKVGICPEEEWPYNEETLYAEPPETCYQSAKKLVLMEYRRVDNTAMDSLLAALTIGPVVGGFTVFQSFESDYVQSTGVAPMPDLTLEMAVGGHAIVVAGHDLDKQVLLVRNSWGTGWGMDGYFTVPLLYFMNGSLADDFWLMQKIT